MNTLLTRSPDAQALNAELHRSELLREAAASRRARSASLQASPVSGSTGNGVISRIRSILGTVGQPAQPDCPEGA
jgi:hypothetical protein